MDDLGTIQQVDPRTIWPNEAADFTPWLASEENMARLGEALGLQFEDVRVEASAGRYNVDIVADEVDAQRKVIIENQLAITDHKHLGQLITYASALEAGFVVWVVADHTEEHKSAIDWLNRQMPPDTINFFLVQIEVIQIDDSKRAPMFHVICQPNDWGREIRKSAQGSGDTSALKLSHQQFWTELKGLATAENSKLPFKLEPKPRYRYHIPFGPAKCYVTLTINTREQYLGCELLLLESGDVYNKLLAHKNEIEHAIGKELEWMPLPQRMRSRVILKRECNPQSSDEREANLRWLVETANKFHEAFMPYL